MDYSGNEESQGHQRRIVLPSAGTQAPDVGEQNVVMPMLNVARIMRTILPADANISDESVEAVQKCTSEFISFITSEASEVCKNDHRRILSADHLITAMNTLGYDNYAHALQIYLRRFRDHEAARSGLPAHPHPHPHPHPAFVAHQSGSFPAPRPISHPFAAGPSLAAQPNFPPARSISPVFFPPSGTGPSTPRYPPGLFPPPGLTVPGPIHPTGTFTAPKAAAGPKIEPSHNVDPSQVVPRPANFVSGPRYPPGFVTTPRHALGPKIEPSDDAGPSQMVSRANFASASRPRYPLSFSAVPKIEPSDDAGPPKFSPFIQAKKE